MGSLHGRGVRWGLALAPLVLVFWYLRLVRTGEAPGIDQFEFVYPTYQWTAAQISSGTFPLWNPYQLAGSPTLATLQGGLLYPFHLIYLLLPVHLGMALSTYLHLLMVGVATLFFGLRVGLRPLPSLLGAVLVCMRGSHAGYVTHVTMLESGAWLVPGLLATLELVRGRRAWGALGVAAATAMSLLAGFPQLSVYAAYAWLFLAAGLLLFEGTPVRRALATLGVCGGAIMLGALMASAQLFPALELSASGVRERGELPLHMMFPFGLSTYGSALEGLQSALTHRVVAPTLWLSFGITGLALLPFAFLHRAQRALVITLAALAVLTLGFAAGPESPLFRLYLALPELASFRVPTRVLVVTDFCFALLAAAGLDALLGWLEQRQGSARSRSPDTHRTGRAGTTLVAAGVSLLAMIEIFAAPPNRIALPYDPDHPRLRSFSRPPLVFEALASSHDRFWAWMPNDEQRLPWRAASTMGVRSISDYDAMISRRQAEYFSYLLWGTLRSQRLTMAGMREVPFYGRTRILGFDPNPAAIIGRIRLAELAAARHLVVSRSARRDPAIDAYLRSKDVAWTGITHDGIDLFEAQNALPRAYITHHALPAPPPPALLSRLSEPGFDPRRASYVEGELGLALREPSSVEERLREYARILRDELHTVEIDAALATPGLLVLSDTFYSGWEVEVDGVPERILATNHLFRGVALEAGRHSVVFRYRPRSVALGLACSALGIAIFAGIAWMWGRTGARAGFANTESHPVR